MFWGHFKMPVTMQFDFRQQLRIPVVTHNLRSYNSHLIVQAIVQLNRPI
jgi:hypothetical protein